MSGQIVGVWRGRELGRVEEREEEKKDKSGRCSPRAGTEGGGRNPTESAAVSSPVRPQAAATRRLREQGGEAVGVAASRS
jgi:hypothetical protein